ncbi:MULTISPECIES: HD domain-containing protein [Eubacterium]|uniref:HDIG domain-containing protein n=1 Tax=Eubacterium ruminantium TaxID=42322 RepID=A0A1T4K041_9FIRM|nr:MULTISPECIES: HD domain-containing protein [Eubacterium]MCR5368079.1 HD domain-containing protein [Eubacterium sp.]SCW28823.1 HDIG domain-containing protein [Eubacterium ruminantium]SDM10490.1 HDIG domain-containing protein [Eubacterium ruminantium]SJZ35739.1 HDIG domain-containing protein [Eubacterium ruminantium]
MNKVDAILKDKQFRALSEMIKEKEFDRIFCRHSLGHALSVARIAEIINLEENLGLDKELIYGTALLHDIGRYSKEEKEGMSHHEAGAIVARPIMERAGFTEEEIELMCNAIRKHKKKSDSQGDLSDVLYRADKLSRNCFMCEAKDECYWDENKKNKTIIY